MQVQVTEDVTLLGLGLRRVLEARLRDEKTARKVLRLRGNFEVRVGAQVAFVTFGPEMIRIAAQPPSKVRARLVAPEGEWLGLLESGAGRGASIIARLEGRVRLRGNPFAALALLSVLGAPRSQRGKIRLARELTHP